MFKQIVLVISKLFLDHYNNSLSQYFRTTLLTKYHFYIGKVKRTLPDNKSWQRNPEKYNLHRVQEITVHGGFIQKIWMNDIAIVTVKKPFKFSHLIGEFICLLKPGFRHILITKALLIFCCFDPFLEYKINIVFMYFLNQE